MNNNEVVFILNDSERIIIELKKPCNEIYCCYRAPIYFVDNDKKYLLIDDTVCSVRDNMKSFIAVLNKALHNTARLHESIKIGQNIKEDIGYLYNEDLQCNSGLIYTNDGEYDFWVGYKHGIWGGKIKTWFFNNDNGDIIFELTPIFPGEFSFQEEPVDQEEIENSLWYEEWIKDYKPILIRTISKEVAEKWLEQANELLKIIEENMKRMLSDGTFYHNHNH